MRSKVAKDESAKDSEWEEGLGELVGYLMASQGVVKPLPNLAAFEAHSKAIVNYVSSLLANQLHQNEIDTLQREKEAKLEVLEKVRLERKIIDTMTEDLQGKELIGFWEGYNKAEEDLEALKQELRKSI